MLALLLALASRPDELELVMISVTYGNVKVESCLRNVVGLFHVLDKEMEWRESQGKPLGFEVLRTYKPIVAVGPEHALEEELLMEDGFRKYHVPCTIRSALPERWLIIGFVDGADGLHGVHEAVSLDHVLIAYNTMTDKCCLASTPFTC